MSNVVRVDENGNLFYLGLLSSQEIATAKEILESLQREIPIVEKELTEKYEKSVLNKYYLGKFLSTLLDKYKIDFWERRAFWDEIKKLATKEDRKRSEGKNSSRRSYYEQCYVLSTIDLDIVKKLSWRQWQNLLDRSVQIEDVRLYSWIKNKKEKIKEKQWQEFLKILNQFSEKKDLSVFSDEETYALFDSFYEMSSYWLKSINKFKIDNPKSLKIEKNSKLRRSKKFYSTCFSLRKEKGKFSDDLFKESFEIAMK